MNKHAVNNLQWSNQWHSIQNRSHSTTLPLSSTAISTFKKPVGTAAADIRDCKGCHSR